VGVGLVGHVWTSRGRPACVGVHERRARPTQVSPRSTQGRSFLPDGVRALIVVVTHCQRAALLLHLALFESRPDAVASGGRPVSL